MFKAQKRLIIVALIVITIFSIFSTAYAAEKYVIKPGDSLFKISKKFNVDISNLIKSNNIKDPSLIYSGAKLKLSANTKDTSDTRDTSDTKDTNNVKNNNNNKDMGLTDKSTDNNDSILGKNTETKKGTNEDEFQEKELAKIYHKNPGTKKVALTFDDGPDEKFTPQVLEVLKKYNAKATFFLVGKRAKKHPDVVKQIIDDGHVIGNHSWAHADLTKLNKLKLRKNIKATEDIIQEITNQKPGLIRPPYGSTSDKVLKQLKDMNYKVVNWSVDSLDWKAKEKGKVIKVTLAELHPGAIILLHSAGGEGQDLTPTIKALPAIIKYLRQQNYELVTVDELLSLSAYKSPTKTKLIRS